MAGCERKTHLYFLGHRLWHHLAEKVVALLHLIIQLCHTLLMDNINGRNQIIIFFLPSICFVFSFSDSSASFNSLDCWLQRGQTL